MPLVVYVNWEIFPASESVWNMMFRTFQNARRREDEDYFPERLTTIRRFSAPDKIILGKQSFFGYVGLEYEKPNTVIFESPFSGNATYFMEARGWREHSQLSKQNLRFFDIADRILHTSEWRHRLRRAMKERNIAVAEW